MVGLWAAFTINRFAVPATPTPTPTLTPTPTAVGLREVGHGGKISSSSPMRSSGA